MTQPAPAPTPVTLFFPFDLGRVFRVPESFDWTDVPGFIAADSRFKLATALFSDEMSIPFRSPVLYRWEGVARLGTIIPWCEAESARFCFTVEGIAMLVVRGQTKLPLDQFREAVERWEQDADAEKSLNTLVGEAAAAFDGLAREAKCRTDLEREGRRVPWLYCVTYSAGPTPYPNVLLPLHPFRSSTIDISWRGAHVRSAATAAPVRELIDAIVAASCLSWEALRALDRLLTRALQQNVLRPHGDDELQYQQAQRLRDIHFFSRYLLGTTDALRWTIREDPLKTLNEIFKVWGVEELRRSVSTQSDLVALQSRQTEQRRLELDLADRQARDAEEKSARELRERGEKEKAEAAKKQSEQLDFHLKIVGLILAAASLFSAASNFITLLNRNDYRSPQEWRYDAALIPLGISVGIVLLIACYFYRTRSRTQGK